MQRVFSSLFSTLSLAILSCLIPVAAKAQVTPDGTTATTVNQEGNDFTVEQGDRVGDNLFHSFDEFSVPTGGSAGFNNAADIANIFSRVTGGNISNIDGLLSASGTANLYLINPNGIIFGENARLDLGGSFFASTADSLLFEGDTEFSAVNPQAAPLLEVNIPIGASFRDNPGGIVNRARRVGNNPRDILGLEVSTGNNLTLVGGDINFEAGRVVTRGGNIYLGGLSEAGIVELSEDGSLNFPEDLNLADITLNNNAGISANSPMQGGNIIVNARNLLLSSGEFGGSFITARSFPDLSTVGEISASNINTKINVTENLTIDNSSIFNNLISLGTDDSNNITIDTGSLELVNGGQVLSNSFGRSRDTQGSTDFNSIDITATGDISADGDDGIRTSTNEDRVTRRGKTSGIFSNQGEVNIFASNLNLTNGGRVGGDNILTQGDGGAINIVTTGDITADGGNVDGLFSGIVSTGNSSNTAGDSGGITISTANLNLTNGGRVDSTTLGQGDAGAIDITATGDITVTGDTPGVARSNLLNSGQVNTNTNTNTSTPNLSNPGTFEVSVTGDIVTSGNTLGRTQSGITSLVNRGAEGNSGGITISTTNLNLSAGGQVDAGTDGIGNAGAVNITASGDITVDSEEPKGNPSGITSQVEFGAEGDSGGVTISTTNLNLTNGGQVSVTTLGTGNAGAVNVTASGDITASGEDRLASISGITSRVSRDAEGDAGGVTISTTNLNLSEGGQIDASTLGAGNAGAVDVTASGDITASGEESRGFPSSITSLVNSGAEGDAGGVTISTTNLNLSEGGRVNASTFDTGNANNVTVNASESISIDGFIERFRSGISTNAFNEDGNGGNVLVTTGELSIVNGGTIEATNFDSIGDNNPGTGQPGSINVTADAIDLSNSARIEAATRFVGEASGNIDLTVAENITLQNNSSISARAFEEADGGNLNIESGFILAFPDGNNDIVARADRGNGGQITIDTEAIFGLEERASEPANLTNDIDASSEFGLQGDFALNTPDFDPTTGLIELPASVSDASDQISQNPCQQGVGSEFIVTGKGGLPSNPTDSLNNGGVEVGLVEPLRQGDREIGRQGKETVVTALENQVAEAVPAMGWVFNDKGEVTLIAKSNTDTEIKRSEQEYTSCKNTVSP